MISNSALFSLGILLLLLGGCTEQASNSDDKTTNPTTPTGNVRTGSQEPVRTQEFSLANLGVDEWVLVVVDAPFGASGGLSYDERFPVDSPLSHCSIVEGLGSFALMGFQAVGIMVQATPVQREPIVERPLTPGQTFDTQVDVAIDLPAGTYGLLIGYEEAKEWAALGATVAWTLSLDQPFAWSIAERGRLVCIGSTGDLETGDVIRGPAGVRVSGGASAFDLQDTGIGWATAYSDLGYRYRLEHDGDEVFNSQVAPMEMDAGQRLLGLTSGQYQFQIPELLGTSGDIGLVVADMTAGALGLLNETEAARIAT